MASPGPESGRFDVVIIGYGPVGALAALSLAHSGLAVLVVERSTDVSDLPRAVALDGESLRAFQRLGLGDRIARICQPPREPNEIVFANSRREVLFGQQVAPFGPNGWCDILFFDQPELEAELRAVVAEHDRIEVRLGERVVSIDQDADEVVVHAAQLETSSEVEYRACYAIGCDGASSFVRSALEVDWQSLDYDQDWLVIDIVEGPGANLPLATMQVCDPERLTSYICVKDPNRRWEFQRLEGETREELESPEKIRALLDSWIEPAHYTLRRSAVYQFHAAVAGRWRVGRVFLAGDAAHQTPPFLGQGLNAGFRDAVNLGWKIPLVLSGACDAQMLDSYAEERDAHARELVDRAVGIGKLMETLAAREAGRPDPHPPESINVSVGGPLVPPIRNGILASDQTSDEHRVGELLRQPIVRTPDGVEQRFDACLGDGFCLVGLRHEDLQLGPKASALWHQLGGQSLALESLALAREKWDPLFEGASAALIRPDRIVFGVVDDRHDLDRLVVELADRMAIT